MKIRLKDFRQSHRLFQSEMAEILGLNQSNVSRAEIKGFLTLTYIQMKTLYDKFGKENVDSFAINEKGQEQKEQHKPEQENGKREEAAVAELTDIVKRQAEAIIQLAARQSEQTDKLIGLMDKISQRL